MKFTYNASKAPLTTRCMFAFMELWCCVMGLTLWERSVRTGVWSLCEHTPILIGCCFFVFWKPFVCLCMWIPCMSVFVKKKETMTSRFRRFIMPDDTRVVCHLFRSWACRGLAVLSVIISQWKISAHAWLSLRGRRNHSE